jgi:hypothetical protein
MQQTSTATPQSKDDLELCFDVPKTTTLKICDRPPLLQGANIQSISTAEFSAKNNVQWTDGILIRKDLKADFTERKATTATLATLGLLRSLSVAGKTEPLPPLGANLSQEVSHYLVKATGQSNEKLYKNAMREMTNNFSAGLSYPYEFVICDIANTVGKGVFLAPTAKKIQPGEIIMLYAGCYEACIVDSNFYPYMYDVFEHPIFASDFSSLKTGLINAEQFRGYAGYIQDLPTDEELNEDYDLSSEHKKQIATANIGAYPFLYQGFPIILLRAIKDILPGEQIGYSYGSDYWVKADLLHQTQRCLFSKQGTLIDNNLYRPKKINLWLPDDVIRKDWMSIPLQFIIDILAGKHSDQYVQCFSRLTQQKTDYSINSLCPVVKKRLLENPESLNNYLKNLLKLILIKDKLEANKSDDTLQGIHIRFILELQFALHQSLIDHGHAELSPTEQQLFIFSNQLLDQIEKHTYDKADDVYQILTNEVMKPATGSRFFAEQRQALKVLLLPIMLSYQKSKKLAEAKTDQAARSSPLPQHM